MKQLENTIQKLKTDPYHAIAVVDLSTLAKVVCNKTGADLQKEYGSVEKFFESLYAKGINSVKIYDRRKNGSTCKAVGDYNIDMTPKNDNHIQSVPATNTPVQQFQQPAKNNDAFGLMGGLNMMDVSYKFQDHSRLTTENEKLRLENETLKEKNTELKETILESKYSSDKSSATNELIKTLAPLLAPVLSKFTAPAEAIGLAAPVENYSPIKNEFFAALKQTDDDFISDLFVIAKGMGNEPFSTELDELMKKHNLIPIQDVA